MSSRFASIVAVFASLAVACIGLQLFGMLFSAPYPWTIIPPLATLAMFALSIARRKVAWLILAWLLIALAAWSYGSNSGYWSRLFLESGWDNRVVQFLPILLLLFCFLSINIRWWKARAGIQEAGSP